MNARHLPPEIEEALDKFAEAVEVVSTWPKTEGADTAQYARLVDKFSRAERKLRRAIFANLKPDAVTEVRQYAPGEEVVWLQTAGAGNSYKPNEKSPLRCVVVREGKKGKVQVQPLDGWRAGDHPSWVLRRNLRPL